MVLVAGSQPVIGHAVRPRELAGGPEGLLQRSATQLIVGAKAGG